MGNIVHTLTNRRYGEKCIAYAESHDQVNFSTTSCVVPVESALVQRERVNNETRAAFAGSGWR